LMANVQAGSYTQALEYYEKIKSAGLTSGQLAAWNEIKNPISAFILKQNLSDLEGTASALLGQAVTALQENDLKDAASSLSRIKSAAQLSKEQTEVLEGILANL
jgi:outer membrane protein assembly factor BamD (BamD/ComL family)